MAVVLPELESLLARAGTNRYLLLQLLEQVTDDGWAYRAGGDAWTAREHLAHVATIDGVTESLLRAPADGAYRLDEALQGRRVADMIAASLESIAELFERLAASRASLTSFIAGLDDARLALPVRVSVAGGWPPERQMSLRAYLASWAEHDAGHTGAIRAAIAIPPGPNELALAARLNRN
jgi:hypothetical protein